MKNQDCNDCEYVEMCKVPFTHECEKFIDGLQIQKGNKTILVNLPDMFGDKKRIAYIINDKGVSFTEKFMDELLGTENMIESYRIVSGLSSAFLEVTVDFDMSYNRIGKLLQPLLLELRQEKYIEV